MSAGVDPSAAGYTPLVTRLWARRRRVEARIAELRLALAAVGPEPADAIGRWRHQEEVWRLQHELDRLLEASRRRRDRAAAELSAGQPA